MVDFDRLRREFILLKAWPVNACRCSKNILSVACGTTTIIGRCSPFKAPITSSCAQRAYQYEVWPTQVRQSCPAHRMLVDLPRWIALGS